MAGLKLARRDIRISYSSSMPMYEQASNGISCGRCELVHAGGNHMELINAAMKAAGHAVEGARVIRKLTGAQRGEVLEDLHNIFKMSNAQQRNHEIQQVAGQASATSAETGDGADLTSTGEAGFPESDSANVFDTDVTSLTDAGDGGILEAVGDAISEIVDWISDLF
jgi:hypothetical protein